MLWPCHWRFVDNLQIVLDAIGGKLDSEKPFAACGRNINLLPNRQHLKNICNTLRVFCGDLEPNRDVDRELLNLLGKPTDAKKWLAASLRKTIWLQMHPPTDLQAVSALTGPDWIEDLLP